MNDNTPSTPSDPVVVRTVRCPTCQKPVAWLEREQYRPFCSRKCQLIDFGDWASERHSIPAEEPPDTLPDDEQ